MSQDAAGVLADRGAVRSVSFSLTEADWAAFQKAASVRLRQPASPQGSWRAERRRRRERDTKLILFALGAVVVFEIAPPEFQQTVTSLLRPLPALFIGIILGLVSVLGPLLFWVFFLSGGHSVRKRLAQSRRRALLAQRTVRINPAGVEHDDGVCSSLTRWVGVEEVAESEGLVVLFTDVTQAFVIPKRAFSTEAEQREFLTLACSYHEQYGPGITSAAGTALNPI